MIMSWDIPITSWMLLASFTLCSLTHTALGAPAPPVTTALRPPSRHHGYNTGGDDSVTLIEQRFPKYFFPESGARDLSFINEKAATSGYGDRNFLRFRSRNLGGYDNSGLRGRNFLRLGRSDLGDLILTGGPMEFAAGLQGEVEEEDLPFKTNLPSFKDNSIIRRFGHRDRTFLRFGRSIDRQLSSLPQESCDEDLQCQEIISTPSPITGTTQDISTKAIVPSESRRSSSHYKKRSAALSIYDHRSMSSYSPVSWARGFKSEEELSKMSSEGPSSLSESQESKVMEMPAEYSHNVRMPRRNYLRFG